MEWPAKARPPPQGPCATGTFGPTPPQRLSPHDIANLFSPEGLAATQARIAALTPATQSAWGKMTVAQMLAHCNVAYEMTYTDKHPRPNALTRLVIRLLAKEQVVGAKPYPRNGRTAPAFVITDERDFAHERQRLLDYLDQTQQLGAEGFEGRRNVSLGKLSAAEWNTLFSKHLDHHLTQFGV